MKTQKEYSAEWRARIGKERLAEINRAAYRRQAKKRVECSERMRRLYPEKRHARQAVGRALKAGMITRQPCMVCNSPESQAHHEDYGRPLDLIWYCTTHHAERHQQINQT